jgi:hypothetical protein
VGIFVLSVLQLGQQQQCSNRMTGRSQQQQKAEQHLSASCLSLGGFLFLALTANCTSSSCSFSTFQDASAAFPCTQQSICLFSLFHDCLQGPTLTLRIKAYSLASDVAASQARPRMPPNAFKTAPLVVLNNFSPQQKQLALAASLFQGMFPSINVHNVNLATCQVSQRVVHQRVDSSASTAVHADCASSPASTCTTSTWQPAR